MRGTWADLHGLSGELAVRRSEAPCWEGLPLHSGRPGWFAQGPEVPVVGRWASRPRITGWTALPP